MLSSMNSSFFTTFRFLMFLCSLILKLFKNGCFCLANIEHFIFFISSSRGNRGSRGTGFNNSTNRAGRYLVWFTVHFEPG